MKLTRLAVGACSLTSVGFAQILPGELLVNTRSPSALAHYRVDGTLVQSHALPGQAGYGAAVMSDGRWVATRHAPTSGLIVYDPESDTELLDLDTPTLAFPGDVEVLSDDTIVVADFFSGDLGHFDAAGNLLATWSVPGASWIAWLTVDAGDEIWCTDFCSRAIYHLDAAGNVLGTLPIAVAMKDLVRAADGTLWMVTASCSGKVYHYTSKGKLLGVVDTGLACLFSVAITPDDTLWVSDGPGGHLYRYDATGNLLSSFPVAGGAGAFTIAAPAERRIGTSYCSANPNSTGAPGRLLGYGYAEVGRNDLSLVAVDLPLFSFALPINSPNQTFVANAGGSAGNLCVGPDIGRHTALLENTGGTGLVNVRVDLTALPRPNGPPQAVQPGETWNFQVWHRDGATSNFTDALSITFQ